MSRTKILRFGNVNEKILKHLHVAHGFFPVLVSPVNKNLYTMNPLVTDVH